MLLLNVHNFMDENTKEILPLCVCLHPWYKFVCKEVEKKELSFIQKVSHEEGHILSEMKDWDFLYLKFSTLTYPIMATIVAKTW